MNLLLFVLLPILWAVISYILMRKYTLFMSIVFQILMFVLSIIKFFEVKTNGTIIQRVGNFKKGVGITLQMDLIGSCLVMLTCFLFVIMLIYSIHQKYVNSLFLFLLIILEGLINGIFLSWDLFNIYVLIEVSTIVVSILIMYKKDSQSIYDGMLYLLINIIGMTFFLLGIGYIYKIFGTLDINLIKENIYLINNPKILIIPYCMIMTSVGLKSAIMPLFSWLPRAHGTPSAPSIVSAILSGLYVKGAIYLFIRIQEVFQPVITTSELFLLTGFLTAIIGFIFALSQTDLKLILAYSTVSQIGFIIFGLSLNSDYSYYGSIYHILNHAIFKSTMFLATGIIIEKYRTRDIRQIRGVFNEMPIVSIAMILAMLGVTGAPFFNGSISKYLIQKATVGSILEYGMIIINLGTILYFIRYSTIFFGQGIILSKNREIKINHKMVVFFLGILCFLGGIFGVTLIQFLLGYSLKINMSSYISKSVIYIISLIISIVFYKYLYEKISILKKIRELEVSFNQICFSIISFFAIISIYMTMKLS